VADDPNAELKYVGLAPGTYVVKAFADGNQDAECEGETDPIVIDEPDEVEVTAEGTDVSCYGEADGYIEVLTTNGTRHELWKDGVKVADDPNAELKYVDLGPGSYVVKAFADGNQDAECEGKTDAIVIDEPDEVEVTAEGTDVSCYGEADGYIEVLTTNGTRHELWKDGVKVADDPNAELKYVDLGPGSYVVKAFADGNQDAECEGETDAIVIDEPDEVEVTAEGTDVSCYGEADGYIEVLTTNGTRHELWKDGVKVADDPNAELKYVDLGPGSYVVKAFVDGNQDAECEGETDAIVIDEPDDLTCTAEEVSQASCDGSVGGSATVYPVGGTPDYTYLWSDADGQTTATATDLAAGDYSVEVTDANGCKTTCYVTITREPEEFICETAFALLGEDSEVGCFLNDGFDRWGWTNLISESEDPYVMPLWAGAALCDTDKGSHVGNAIVTYTGGTITVEYVMFGGNVLKEAHVYVGYEPYPYTKGKNSEPTVAPGQYNYNSGPLDDVDGLTDIVFDGLNGDDVYIIIHGVACEAVCMWDEPESLAVGFYQDLSPTKGKKSATIEVSGSDVNSLKAYPNPFSHEITFEFVSRNDARAVLEITNVLGQKITTLMDRQVQEGVVNRISYIPENVQSGMLIYRLILDNEVQTGRLLYRE
jgi:uncharacterized protein (DUF2141 family)